MKRRLPLPLVELSASSTQNRAQPLPSQLSNQWVQLISPPDAFSYEQALLLVKQSEDEWLAWVPDYGEVTLHISEFFFPHEWN